MRATPVQDSIGNSRDNSRRDFHAVNLFHVHLNLVEHHPAEVEGDELILSASGS